MFKQSILSSQPHNMGPICHLPFLAQLGPLSVAIHCALSTLPATSRIFPVERSHPPSTGDKYKHPPSTGDKYKHPLLTGDKYKRSKKPCSPDLTWQCPLPCLWRDHTHPRQETLSLCSNHTRAPESPVLAHDHAQLPLKLWSASGPAQVLHPTLSASLNQIVKVGRTVSRCSDHQIQKVPTPVSPGLLCSWSSCSSGRQLDILTLDTKYFVPSLLLC